MIDEAELRASYLNGLSTLRSQRELTGPADGMYWLMPFAIAVERAGGDYNPSLIWPDYADLSGRERKAAEMIRASLSTSRKDLVDYAGFGSALYQFVYALFSINEKWKKERRYRQLPRSFLQQRETNIHQAIYDSPTYCAVTLVNLINRYRVDADGNPVDADPDEHLR
ncbi:hypothetical protein J2R99_001225 [Rhodopseudomonas julia]|uniref:Uncharacterized protein n=1 Tax=Rhodopseudomonas julia TaxID=200617 RepID=A0ABU0C4E1_9BRAD|nr:hypothetical protein [Rhodopseudomonas julia]MDQ0325376.1 hypothetical protein [Rhodopseudomonas julia]